MADFDFRGSRRAGGGSRGITMGFFNWPKTQDHGFILGNPPKMTPSQLCEFLWPRYWFSEMAIGLICWSKR